MSQEILDELRKLRQDVEVQSAINVIEGIHTMETLAALGHFIRTRRPPTPREATALESMARRRWAEQVRHVLGVLKNETPLDERMTSLADLLAQEAEPRAKSPKAARKAARPKSAGKARKRRK